MADKPVTAWEAIDAALTKLGYVNKGPQFGDPEWIQKVKENERRDKLVEAMKTIFDEFGDMDAFEMGYIISTAAHIFYGDTDVQAIYDFVRGVSKP